MEPYVLEQYICAGNVARNVMFWAMKLLRELQDPSKSAELGPLIDEYIVAECSKFLPLVKDKGVAKPCEVLARLTHDDKPDRQLIHKISFAVHFDGHAVVFSHSLLPGLKSAEEDLMADALIATQLATEAVIALLGTALVGETVSGVELRYVVETIAEEFDCFVTPTTYLTVQSRFNFGQLGAPRDTKFVGWGNTPVSDDFKVSPDEVWVVDIVMTPKRGRKNFSECLVLTGNERRQFTVISANFCNKEPIPDELQPKMAPFLASGWPQRASNHGGAAELYSCIKRDLLIPWMYPPVQRPCPKQATSVLLSSAQSSRSGIASVVRLSGGTQFPPTTFGGTREVKNELIQNLLRMRYSRSHGVSFLELHGC